MMEKKPLKSPSLRLILLCMLMALFALKLHAQRLDARLASMILLEVNRVRDSVGQKPLLPDATLQAAATMQAAWCKQHDSLSHYQHDSKRLYEPFQRVQAVGGIHDGVGENLLYRYPQLGEDPELLAMKIAWQWVHSPGHFKNMTSPNYGLSGIGMAYDRKNGRLYVCQVFAIGKWDMPIAYKVPKRTYRIRPQNSENCAELDQFAGRDREFCYGFRYTDGAQPRIFFHHDDRKLVQSMIGKRKDAIASDIIFRNQFPCARANALHGSPYFDGYLQRPRTWKWLDKHSELEEKPADGKRIPLNVYTAKVASLPADSIQVNAVFFKGGHYCRYAMPVSGEMGNLAARSFNLPPDTLPFVPYDRYTRRRISFRVPFAKGVAQPNAADLRPLLDSLRATGGEVVHLHIRGWASIEGPLSTNEALFTQRAENIRKALQARQQQVIPLSSSAAENWADFRRDIRYSPFKWMAKLSDAQVRDTLMKSLQLETELEYLLAQHRYAAVDMDFRFETPAKELDVNALQDSLVSALEHKHYLLAHRLQSECVRQFIAGKLDPGRLLQMRIPTMEATLPLLYNKVWLAEQSGGYAAWVDEVEALGVSKSYPWFHLRQLARVNREMAEGSFRPKDNPMSMRARIRAWEGQGLTREIREGMEVNYWMAMAHWQFARGHVDAPVLDSLRDRYAGASMDADEAVQLGRFFNKLKAKSATLRLILPMARANAEHEDLVFLLAWTAAARLDLVSEDEWLGWMEKAHALNAARWTQLVDVDWQLLRWERIKRLYCNCAQT